MKKEWRRKYKINKSYLTHYCEFHECDHQVSGVYYDWRHDLYIQDKEYIHISVYRYV